VAAKEKEVSGVAGAAGKAVVVVQEGSAAEAAQAEGS
jgi:hypothetical protein